MHDGGPVANLQVWSMSAPAVKKNPDLMFALCSVEPGSTAEKLVLKQKEPPSDEVGGQLASLRLDILDILKRG